MSSSGFVKYIAVFVFLIQSYEWGDLSWPSILQPSKSQDLIGLILARQGSKGVSRKNLALLNGKPLISYALSAMIESEIFSTIWISTNDEEIENYVTGLKLNNVKIHKRAEYTATDEASSLIAVQEFLNHHGDHDFIGLVQCTSPFIKAQYLRQAWYQMMFSDLDSVFSVTRSHSLRWAIGLEGLKMEPLNFDPNHRPRRQDWEGELVENGMFYFSTKNLIQNGKFQGERSGYVEIDKADSLEIDTVSDMKLAEFILTN